MTTVADKLATKSARKTAQKQVRLRLVHVDFWAAAKFSFLVWLALGIMLIVFAFLVYMVLELTGVFSTIDGALSDVSKAGAASQVSNFLGLGPVMIFATIVAALNLIVGTVLGAVAAWIYNAIVKITGGLIFGFTNA